MAQQGTYEQLLSERDGEFAAMMRDYINEDQKSATDEAHVRMIKAPDAVAKEADATKSTTRYQLVKQEEMMIGSISRGVWRSWAAGLGPMMWIVLVLALCESSAFTTPFSASKSQFQSLHFFSPLYFLAIAQTRTHLGRISIF